MDWRIRCMDATCQSRASQSCWHCQSTGKVRQGSRWTQSQGDWYMPCQSQLYSASTKSLAGSPRWAWAWIITNENKRWNQNVYRCVQNIVSKQCDIWYQKAIKNWSRIPELEEKAAEMESEKANLELELQELRSKFDMMEKREWKASWWEEKEDWISWSIRDNTWIPSSSRWILQSNFLFFYLLYKYKYNELATKHLLIN